MLSNLRSRLTYANVMATIAVFVALGGTSYAVATGSIDSREIKNNSVRSKDIRNDTVRGRDVRNGSLLARDFEAGQLAPRGPRGPRGSRGARGAPGSPGVSGLQRVVISSASSSDSEKVVTATCPAGKRAIGTGAYLRGGLGGGNPNVLTDVVIASIVPSREVPGRVEVVAIEEEPTNASWRVGAIAICANAS